MPFDAKLYKGYVEGPLGFAQKDEDAKLLDTYLKTEHPKGNEFGYRRKAAATDSDLFELEAESRTDVSFITTDAVDRSREVVLPKGMDKSGYNGVVAFAHMYDALPVGRNLWIKSKETTRGKGLVAKTQYATKPDDWEGDWMPDAVFSLIQQGTCTGKSIGFLPLAYREPTEKEVEERPELGLHRVYIIDKWKLLEYSVVPVPCNDEAETVSVSKSLGLSDKIASEIAKFVSKFAPQAVSQPKNDQKQPELIEILAYLDTTQLKSAILSNFSSVDPKVIGSLVEKRIADILDRAMGRV